MSHTQSRGNIFIVAAPSGGGKTSLVKALLASLPNIEVSTSHTTRAMRPKEQHGVDYFFIDTDTFLSMIEKEEFIEHAAVFEHHYGTSKAQIESRLQQGIDVVLDIDWQGADQIKTLFPKALSIFVIPPSLEVLKDRLHCRGQDKAEVIQKRMHQATDELRHYTDFDYLIVNDHFETAAQELRSIVLSSRLTIDRQAAKHAKLLSILLK